MADNAAKRKKKHRYQNVQIRNTLNEKIEHVKTPRLIQVVEFAAHHMAELKYLEETLIANQPPPDGRPNLLPQHGKGWIDTKGRRQFQTLPRHLRRRSASHNLYRIPYRLRYRAQMEVEKSAQGSKKKGKKALEEAINKKPHRRHKRRPKFLRVDYLRRQQSTGLRWLETHIWSRKRMHVEPQWGYYMPIRMSDKGIRAGYKNSAYIATLHDASYNDCLRLRGSKTDFEALFSHIFPVPGCDNYKRKGIEYSRHMYSLEQYPSGYIGEIRFLWELSPTTKDCFCSAMFWIHPSIYDEVLGELERVIKAKGMKMECIPKRGDFLRYELTGPRSHAILQTVLKLSSCDSENHSFWEELASLRSCAELPRHCVLSLTVNNPEKTFPPPPAKKSLATQADTNPKEREKLLQQLMSWQESHAVSSIWEYSVDIMDKKDIDIPILLVQRPGGDREYSFAQDVTIEHNFELGSGWDIIIPKNCGMKFWKSLVYAGARVIGVTSQTKMNLERGALSFPLDYIDSQAYKIRKNELMKEEKNRFEKKPPSKRVNFAKINSMFPWKLSWSRLNDWWSNKLSSSEYYRNLFYSESHLELLNSQMKQSDLFVIRECNKIIGNWLYSDDLTQIPIHVLQSGFLMVRISMDIRGTPNNEAFICFPNHDDIKKMIRGNVLASELDIEPIKHFVSSKPDTDQEFLFEMKRDIVGFVTSGGHVYSQGKGSALACCSFLALYLLRRCYDKLDEDFGRVLVRNVTSRQYLPAKLSLPASAI